MLDGIFPLQLRVTRSRDDRALLSPCRTAFESGPFQGIWANLVHRGDQQGRGTVDFLIHHHHWEPFLRRVPLREIAATQIVSAVSNATADIAGRLIDSEMLFSDFAAAPRA